MRASPVTLLVLAMGAGLVACAPSAQRSPAQPDRSMVTRADLENPNEPIEMVLQRKVPGLRVTRTPEGEIALQIRGATTFYGKEQSPLFLLDGLPFTPGAEGALTGINPNDIETIKVLKGPEAMMYGNDGVHGVVLITTRRARPR